jgi:hypothetical protein
VRQLAERAIVTQTIAMNVAAATVTPIATLGHCLGQAV